MIITSKYKIGDKVWFKGDNGRCIYAIITEIHISQEGITYSFFLFDDRPEKDIFLTKEELLNNTKY